jgi:hypothetical protein
LFHYRKFFDARYVYAGRLACTLIALAAASQPLLAQEANEEPVDDDSYSFFLNTGAGRFTGDYGEPEDSTLDVLSVTARWYLTRAELQLTLPVLRLDGSADIRFVDGQPVSVPGGSIPGTRRHVTGLGDAVLRGEYYLRTGTATSPWIIGQLRLKVPTGDEDSGLGTGAADLELGVGLIQRYGQVNWLADVGYTLVGHSSGSKPRNVLRLGGGVSIPFGADDRNSAYAYLENRSNRYQGTEDRRELALGVGTALDQAKRLRVTGSIFFGLSDSVEDIGLYLTIGRRY